MECFCFLRFECLHAHHHVVPVNLVSVEVRSVYAHELCLTTNVHTAATAHSCSVDHDCVQRNNGMYFVRLCCLACELHHDWRSNCDYFSRWSLRLALLFKRNGNKTFCSCSAVVCHDDYFISNLLHLFNEDEQILIASTNNHSNIVASFFERLNDWVTRSHTNTAAHYNNWSVILFNLRRISERAKNSTKLITRFFLRKLIRCCANCLEHQSNPSFFSISICNSKRNALTKIDVELNKHKLTGFAVFRNVSSLNSHVIHVLRELFLFKNLVHIHVLKR